MGWQALWDWLSVPQNQKTLAWIGGILVACVVAGYRLFEFLASRKRQREENRGASVTASDGGVAAGGDITGSRITTHGPSSPPRKPPRPPNSGRESR
jgi:hypothetical protein